MSLEEKVGQILMVHFLGEIANEDARVLVEDVRVGGIIYYSWSNGLRDADQVRALSSALQKLSMGNPNPIPLLIATDQEGGVVARLQSGFTHFPGNRALAETGDSNLAKMVALATGLELSSVGINMNLAPVVDVNSNPKNPVIGLRSFGDEAEVVTAFGKKALDGFKQSGIITTLKHFPGHGDVSLDSHKDLPVIHKSKAELEQVELVPFVRLASSADAIMTAHILVSALDSENCATLSKKTLEYLRETIGFQGVIVTDSMIMGGVLKRYPSIDEACVVALNAGCDLLLLGGRLLNDNQVGLELTPTDIQRIHRFIIQAVQDGVVPEDRLNAAVERILTLKKRYLHPEDGRVSKIDLPAHRELAQKIASLALRTKKIQTDQIISLEEKNICLIAPEILRKNLESTSIFQIGKSTAAYFLAGLNPSEEELKIAQDRGEAADVVVLCSYNGWKNPAFITLYHSLLALKKPLIVLCLRDPLDASLFSDANLVFTLFDPTVFSIQEVCEKLRKY